uniref:hypothetical protein n=1 Tax=Rheinheimera sp. TaxID=1869214 RepID=UPI0040471007
MSIFKSTVLLGLYVVAMFWYWFNSPENKDLMFVVLVSIFILSEVKNAYDMSKLKKMLKDAKASEHCER